MYMYVVTFVDKTFIITTVNYPQMRLGNWFFHIHHYSNGNIAGFTVQLQLFHFIITLVNLSQGRLQN